ncbi:MAG: GNAT family N-acetyltransferase [Gemmatimonadaceae bacterium]
MNDVDVRIRPAHADDAGWITALAPRLHEFGPPPWREVAAMDAAVAAGLARELASPSPGSAILAAEDASGTPVGFISLRTDRDYFSDAPCGHVTDLVVAGAGEGRGVGRSLLAAAERWAEEAGYPWLTLHVFEGNDRARRLYEQTGYAVEWTRMLKSVGARRAVRSGERPGSDARGEP